MSRVLRVLAVMGFLYAMSAAPPAAAMQTGCNEYDCRVYINCGSGWVCVPEDQIYCGPAPNCDYGYCGQCVCGDAGDCYLDPFQ